MVPIEAVLYFVYILESIAKPNTSLICQLCGDYLPTVCLPRQWVYVTGFVKRGLRPTIHCINKTKHIQVDAYMFNLTFCEVSVVLLTVAMSYKIKW